MKQPFTRDFWTWDNLRATWEYKTLRFILRAVLAVAVVFYLLLTLPFVWPWAKTQYVRHQPPARFAELVGAGIASGDFTPAMDWLSRRPRAERPLHIPVIRDNVTVLPPALLAWLGEDARARGDIDGLRFWQMMVRYRMRYDLVRCGNPTLVAKVNELLAEVAKFNIYGDQRVLAEVERDPAQLADLLQKVLDFDAQNPMRNDPRTTCESMKGLSKITYTPMPPEGWAQSRHILRLATEHGIAELRQKAGTVPPVPPAAAPPPDETPVREETP
jgi:hypothetical protein